jgi:hypothetical protein
LQRRLGCQTQQHRSMATRVEQQAAANPGKAITARCSGQQAQRVSALCVCHMQQRG